MCGNLPGEIETMLRTLNEMYNGSIPDETADYFDLRQSIEEHIYSLKILRTNILDIGVKYEKKDK